MNMIRQSPSGPIVGNGIYEARGTVQIVDPQTAGNHFTRLSGPQPQPNLIEQFNDETELFIPPGKYSVNFFGRFANPGTAQTVWQVQVDDVSIFTWGSNPTTENDWLNMPSFFSVSSQGIFKIKYTNTGADGDALPSIFGGRYLITRLGDA